MIIYIPLEHIENRYTVHLDNDVVRYLEKTGQDYIRIGVPRYDKKELPEGMFLDAGTTIKTKANQIEQITELYEKGIVNNETTFFFSDLWFPGIESLAYLNYFYKVNPKITGVIHAGSFTDTDFVRDMERWAKNFEDIVFDICSTIFVASNFIKNDIIKKRIIDPSKLVVTHLPLDNNLYKYRALKEKKNIVIFNGRICDEKQPWLFDELKKYFKDVQFISTQEYGLKKDEYYRLLARAKVVVSFALQENFGYGVAEAVELGCIPIVPNKLVYPELYEKQYRYDTFQECVELVSLALSNDLEQPTNKINTNPFKTWFK